MLFYSLFIALIYSQIPEQYKSLVEKALSNSKIKTPKELREDTKYPGFYEGPKYHFKLLKPFTSSNTNDIKGFATDDEYCAIVKRKKFNLTNDFIFVEPETQQLYKLENSIASDEKVSIYKIIKTKIFYVMTDFELRESTIMHSRSPNGMHNPYTFLDVPVKWIQKDNRPEMMKLKDTEIEMGMGMNTKINIDAVFVFNSIWDAKITANIFLESRLGGEINIPDDTTIEIEEHQFYEFSIQIPRMNFSLTFMNIDISFCLNFNLDVSLTDMEVAIPVGFDYFKGYKMSASKYFEISKYSKVNPDWKIELVNLPEVNTISETAKRITESSFTANFQIQPYFTLDIQIGDIEANLDLGLKIPFIFDFNYDVEKCLFPYLTGSITFPFKMFYHFSGINYEDIIDIIDESEEEKILFQMNVGPFCIGGSETFMEGSDSLIQDASRTVYYAKSTNFHESRKENTNPYNKQIVFTIHETDIESKILDQRFYPYSYYDQNQNNDVIMIIQGIPETGSLEWNINYKDGSSMSSQSETYAHVPFDQLQFENDHTATIDVEISKVFDDPKYDVTYFTFNIEKCQIVQPGKVFIRKWKYISFEPFFPYDGKYSMIYFTQEGKMLTNSAQYMSNNMANLDFAQTGDYQETNENFDIFLDQLYTSHDNILYADIEIYLKYKFNGEQKEVQLGTFFIQQLEKLTTYSAEAMGINEISFNCFIPKSMEAKISVSGVINFETDGIHLIDEIDIFDSENTDSKDVSIYTDTTATFSCSPIIPSITADCSAESSNEVPAQEILAENYEINDIKMSNKISIHFRENEMFKFLRIIIPPEFSNTYLGFITPEDNILSFLYKDESRTSVMENFFYFNVKDKTRIDIPIRRSEIYDKSYDLQLEFFKFGASELVILDSIQGKKVEFDDKIQRAIIVPTFNNQFYFIADESIQGQTMNEHFINLDEFNGLYFRNYAIETQISCTFYLSYTHITNSQPLITVDLTHMKYLLNENRDSITFNVICSNGKEVIASVESKTRDGFNSIHARSPIKNGVSELKLSNVGVLTLAPICHDPTGSMCLIEYEKPEKTGFHLIRYPDKNGISTTGSGFWTEAIPVVANQSFMYYKTSNQSIMKYKEYPPDPIKIIMRVEDLYDEDYTGDGHYRQICLIDAAKTYNTIPFSRRYFNEHMLDFLGYFNTLNITNFDNDKDGCILIHYTFINADNITVPPQEACDIPTIEPFELDTSGIKKDFADKAAKRKKKNTIIISVVCSLVAVGLIVIVVILVLRKEGILETP